MLNMAFWMILKHCCVLWAYELYIFIKSSHSCKLSSSFSNKKNLAALLQLEYKSGGGLKWAWPVDCSLVLWLVLAGAGWRRGVGRGRSLRSLLGDPSAGTPALSASCRVILPLQLPCLTRRARWSWKNLDSEPGCGVTVSSPVKQSRGVSWAGSAAQCPHL